MEKRKTVTILEIVQKNYFQTCLVENKDLKQKKVLFNTESPDLMLSPKRWIVWSHNGCINQSKLTFVLNRKKSK